MSLWRSFSRLNIHVKSLSKSNTLPQKITTNWFATPDLRHVDIHKNEIHTSSTRQDLMEFFDDKNTWGEQEVRVGRSWKLEELRIKSNTDLHKLWYVLLKEKNMLLTMEHEYHRLGKGLPNPERIDKVEESMENLEKVVRERNRAYFTLETGETGERPIGKATSCFGLDYTYKMREHLVEKRFNKKYLERQKLYNHTTDHAYVKDFLTRLEEKKRKRRHALLKKLHSKACELMKIFPHLDEEALQEQFPDLNIESVKKDPNSRTHGENKY